MFYRDFDLNNRDRAVDGSSVAQYMVGTLSNCKHTLAPHTDDAAQDLHWPIWWAWHQLQNKHARLGTLYYTFASGQGSTSRTNWMNTFNTNANPVRDTAVSEGKNSLYLSIFVATSVSGAPVSSFNWPESPGYQQLIDQGWEEMPRLATLLTVNRHAKVHVLRKNKTSACPTYAVYTNSRDMEIMPKLATLLGSMIDPPESVDNDDLDTLLKWIAFFHGDLSSSELEQYFLSMPHIRNYAEQERMRQLIAAADQIVERSMRTVDSAYTNAKDRFETATTNLRTARETLRVAENNIFLARLGQSTIRKKLDEAIEYWKNCIRIEQVFVQDNVIWLDIVTPVINFDEVAFNAVMQRKYAVGGRLHKTWNLLLNTDRWQLMCAARVLLPVPGNITMAVGAIPKSFGMPNYHLTQFTCFGDYRALIEEAAQNMDFIRTTDLLIASVSNINFRDTVVMQYFDRELERGGDCRAIEEVKTRRRYTIDEWWALIQQEEETAARAAAQAQGAEGVENETHTDEP